MTETAKTDGAAGPKRRKRSALPKDAARLRYLEIGALAALEQIRRDAQALDVDAMAIGPFARLDAGAVAAREGKTRGAVTNLFGSQAAYQAATMSMALDAGEIAELADWPDPTGFADAGAWIEAFFASQSACGPQHGVRPATTYASLWVLWLGAVPYGVWSERVAAPSMVEFDRRLTQLEAIFAEALTHFGLSLRPGVTLANLAAATASLIEGVWLNQCLTGTDPRDSQQPISNTLVRAGRLLWNGAVET
jgi:hypothetical protein